MARAPLVPFERIGIELTSEVVCVRCPSTLERHQPDGDRPDRLLGTCPGCGAWYLIDLATAVMIVLPVSELLAPE
jgi:hypothetical protein